MKIVAILTMLVLFSGVTATDARAADEFEFIEYSLDDSHRCKLLDKPTIFVSGRYARATTHEEGSQNILEFSRQVWEQAQCSANFPESGVSYYAPEGFLESWVEHLRTSYTSTDVVSTGWTPGKKLKIQAARRVETQGGAFGPQARDAIQAWQSQNGISDTGNFVNTLALMIQTALVLQDFDPGPVDGLFGKKTLAAILAWQAAMGYAQTGDLAGVLAAILRTVLVLQGFDPGPLDAMFGTQAHDAIQAWQPGHTQALAERPTDPDVSKSKNEERHVARAAANNCIRVYRPPGVTALTGFSSRMENNCNFRVHVTHGFNVKLDGTPIHQPWCTVGRGGSKGGDITLDPGESEPVAPIDYRVDYTVYWCACNDVYSWAAFAEPGGQGVDDCLCRCAPN